MTGFCLRCGATRTEGAAFCADCGEPLGSPDPVTVPAAAKAAPTLLHELNAESTLTPLGQFVAVLGLAAVLAGLFVGFGMSVHSIGVSGTSLAELAGAHPVNCGTAFQPEWRSVACEQALSGRRTAAWVLLIAGSVVAIGGFAFLRQAREQPARTQESS